MRSRTTRVALALLLGTALLAVGVGGLAWWRHSQPDCAADYAAELAVASTAMTAGIAALPEADRAGLRVGTTSPCVDSSSAPSVSVRLADEQVCRSLADRTNDALAQANPKRSYRATCGTVQSGNQPPAQTGPWWVEIETGPVPL